MDAGSQRRAARARPGLAAARAAVPQAGLVTVLDGHPATLSWLGSVGRHRVQPLGVTQFGQSGDIPDLYRACGLDVDAILDAARLCVAPALSN